MVVILRTSSGIIHKYLLSIGASHASTRAHGFTIALPLSLRRVKRERNVPRRPLTATAAAIAQYTRQAPRVWSADFPGRNRPVTTDRENI